ncbi:MAG TPA: flagellar motor protein MotB [Caulobacterales bacterium]|nr:flagellar motor protein MotB [Caulobacterales bacterium]
MAAGAKSNQPTIIIKKIKKGGGGGHHGGAWKVAYADFVTAMMAFFLLMWLINTTTPEQKRGIADYFAPASVSQTTSGSGGMLAGKALSAEGVRADKGSPVIDSAGQGVGSSDSPDSKDSQAGKDDAAEKAKEAAQNAEFEKAEMSIRQAMQDMPEIAELSKQVIMEITPEGLRIQIIDQDGRSMFPPGDARPYERTARLLAAISGIIAELPNRLAISGHTDGSPPARPGQSNWELSADRANASRRVLQASGIPNGRISSVAGKADSEPLFPDDPTLPGNRRVSITLLREAPVLPPGHSL